MPDPATITMNISLPEPLKRFVDGKVASGLYGSASEFVREAIREKLAREQQRDELTAKLLEGLDSGQPLPFTDNYIDNKKRAFQKKRSTRKRA